MKNSCPLCKNSKISFFLKKNYSRKVYYLWRCLECTLVYVFPQPSLLFLKRFYDSTAYSKKWLSQCPIKLVNFFEKKDKGRVMGYKTYSDEIEKYKTEGKFLDVGCGDGAFFDLLDKKKWRLYGVDISSKVADFLKKKKEIKFFHGDLKKANYKKNFFDVITLMDVIEHVREPLALLKEINRILKNEGIFCLHTINIDSLIAKVKKEKWCQISPPGHLFYFNPNSINLILKKAGFKILDLRLTTAIFSSLGNFGFRLNWLFCNFFVGEEITIYATKLKSKT